jgi:GT2 family glycosyltransferase
VVPTVSIVFLVFNRREKLRASLQKMLAESDYPADRLDVIVVDNGSTDGSGDMVRTEFPSVRLIVRDENVGVSGWNDGFAAVRGDYALVLDDDCYLPRDGLREAVRAAQADRADLVSFSVTDEEASHRFNDDYNTGLLSFWGCAVLMRREVLEELGGYDPEIFVWANELEFMVRFFDRGFRHLHLPGVVAIHMKTPTPIEQWMAYGYRINSKHYAYIAGKLLRPRDAVSVFAAVVATTVRDAYRDERSALHALPHILRGFVRGLRRRAPVRKEVSRMYRRNMHSFASPLAFARKPREVVTAIPHRILRAVRPGASNGDPGRPGRREEYFAERARFYPDEAASLQVGSGRADVTTSA